MGTTNMVYQKTYTLILENTTAGKNTVKVPFCIESTSNNWGIVGDGALKLAGFKNGKGCPGPVLKDVKVLKSSYAVHLDLGGVLKSVLHLPFSDSFTCSLAINAALMSRI